MSEQILEITLRLSGPVLTRSGAAGSLGIDAPVARRDGRAYLPGSLVKGKLLQAWRDLDGIGGFCPEIEPWLGKKTGNLENPDGAFTPERALLHFDDFLEVRPTCAEESPTRYRVRLDDATGAADSGCLQMIESPWQPGEIVEFAGRIRYRSLAPDPEVEKACRIGLRWIAHFGAGRSLGFGRTVGVDVKAVTVPGQAVQAALSPADLIPFALVPEGPFCIAGRRIADNIFESEDVIPGNVIKGCVANAWLHLLGRPGGFISAKTDSARAELCRHFEHIRFTHAFPGTNEGKRPLRTPESSVQAGKKQPGVPRRVWDVALLDGPVLIGNSAPEFAVDWKNPGDSPFVWPDLKKEIRTRTAVSEWEGRAEQSQLFAYESIIPDGRPWFGSIDLSDVPASERGIVAQQLVDVAGTGLTGLGKTKASARLVNSTASPLFASDLDARDGVWVVMLQTAAILNEPDADCDLHSAYDAAWRSLSKGQLKMKRFYARQSLAGGLYLHRTFQRGKAYEPWLLSAPGSVFVLTAAGDPAEARSMIQSLYEHGLPLPEWAVKRYARAGNDGEHWSNNPYIRQNGYGEITVNLESHWGLCPAAGECHAL